MQPRTERAILLWLLILAVLLRLAFSLPRDAHRGALNDLPDQDGYIQCARNWVLGDGWKYRDERFAQDVYAVRTMGYPAFLVVCNNATVRLARGMQGLVDASTALAAFLVARRLFGQAAGLIAAGLVALNPFMIYFSALILSETLYTSMLAWSMYLLICRRQTFAAALLLAAGAMVRPSGLPLAIILPTVATLAFSEGWRKALKQAAVATLLTLLLFVPWAYRNHHILGSWVWTTTNGGITAYDGLNAKATGASDQSFVSSMPELLKMDEVERDKYLGKLARDFVLANPGRTLQLAVTKIARTWSPIPLSQQFGSSRLYVLAGLGYSLPLFILALLAIPAARASRSPAAESTAPKPRPYPALLLLCVPAISLTLIHAASVGSLRYRIPVEPQIAILAASGAVWLSGRLLRSADDAT